MVLAVRYAERGIDRESAIAYLLTSTPDPALAAAAVRLYQTLTGSAS